MRRRTPAVTNEIKDVIKKLSHSLNMTSHKQTNILRCRNQSCHGVLHFCTIPHHSLTKLHFCTCSVHGTEVSYFLHDICSFYIIYIPLHSICVHSACYDCDWLQQLRQGHCLVSIMFRFSYSLILSHIWFGVLPLIPRCGESLYRIMTVFIIIGRFPSLSVLARYLRIFFFNVLVRRCNLLPVVKWLSFVTLAYT